MPSPPPPSVSWQARAPTILPLVFLQAIANTFTLYPLFTFFRAIECEAYSLRAPVHIPELDLCKLPQVVNSATTDMAIFIGVATLFGVLVAGHYSRVSDLKGRRRVMGIAAAIQLLGCFWRFTAGMFSLTHRCSIIECQTYSFCPDVPIYTVLHVRRGSPGSGGSLPCDQCCPSGLHR